MYWYNTIFTNTEATIKDDKVLFHTTSQLVRFGIPGIADEIITLLLCWVHLVTQQNRQRHVHYIYSFVKLFARLLAAGVRNIGEIPSRTANLEFLWAPTDTEIFGKSSRATSSKKLQTVQFLAHWTSVLCGGGSPFRHLPSLHLHRGLRSRQSSFLWGPAG